MTVDTLAGLVEHWAGNTNFYLDGECVPFNYEFPPAAELIDALRHDPDVRILRGGVGNDHSKEDIREAFRALPIDEALRTRFHLSHFKLPNFYDGVLAGFEAGVMEPWRDLLSRAGFTWERCYPIVFISGPNCGSSYHMDLSHVVAWEIYGTKRFCGLQEPDRFSPIADCVRREYRDALTKPELRPDEVHCLEQPPGTVVWNQLLTPHWVESADEVAVSVNLSHGFLRHRGELCPNEAALARYWEDHPAEAWRAG